MTPRHSSLAFEFFCGSLALLSMICGACSSDTPSPGSTPTPEAGAPDAKADAVTDAKSDSLADTAVTDIAVKDQGSDSADSAPAIDATPPPPPTYSLDCSKHPGLLHQIFTDHMVLQRDAWVSIWGCTTPAGLVKVTLGSGTASATASSTGFWSLRLPPMPAGGPHQLVVEGKETVTLKDVLLGDVWLCSGQSNMVWKVSNSLNAAQEIADAVNHPTLRLFTVPSSLRSTAPQDMFASAPQWGVPSPAVDAGAGSVAGFSATCYFFARELSKSIQVPLGLINSAVGGTPIQDWMSEKTLLKDPDLADDLAAVLDGSLPETGAFVTSLYNGMIAPLLPFSLRGMVWYQGESNASTSSIYQRLLTNMIADWRDRFAVGEAPFLVVQLPSYGKPQSAPTEGTWPGLREAQLKTYQTAPNVGLAITIDTGDRDSGALPDGGYAAVIHPPDKQDIGERLALVARGLAYGEALTPVGPTYKSMKVEGATIRVSFDNAQEGLMVGSKKPLQPVQPQPQGKLTGFAIAGANKTFVWATAAVEGSEVVVQASGVTAPVAVRYGWGNAPPCNLYSKAGLPASPFRTDSW